MNSFERNLLREAQQSLKKAAESIELVLRDGADVPDPVCPKCNVAMKLRQGQYGQFWGCSNFPDCNVTINADNAGNPIGEPADTEVKDARKKAHRAFDRLWKEDYLADREEAYKWLAEQLGVREKQAHIGTSDIAQCERIVQLCKAAVDKEDKRRGRKTETEPLRYTERTDDADLYQPPAWSDDDVPF